MQLAELSPASLGSLCKAAWEQPRNLRPTDARRRLSSTRALKPLRGRAAWVRRGVHARVA